MAWILLIVFILWLSWGWKTTAIFLGAIASLLVFFGGIVLVVWLASMR